VHVLLWINQSAKPARRKTVMTRLTTTPSLFPLPGAPHQPLPQETVDAVRNLLVELLIAVMEKETSNLENQLARNGESHE
jgi:hypothetical protein